MYVQGGIIYFHNFSNLRLVKTAGFPSLYNKLMHLLTLLFEFIIAFDTVVCFYLFIYLSIKVHNMRIQK